MSAPRPSSSGPSPGTSALLDVLDRVLDRGIVIDAEVRVSLIGLELAGVDARIVVASIETYLEHAEDIAETFPVSWRWVGQTNLGSPRIPESTGQMPRNRLRPFLDDQDDGPPFFDEED